MYQPDLGPAVDPVVVHEPAAAPLRQRTTKKTYKWPTGTGKGRQHRKIVREMQSKTTLRYRFTPVRRAVITERGSHCKRVTQEDPELTSARGHIKSTGMYRTISCERNLVTR